MRRRSHEVDLVRIYNQQWRFVVPVKVVRIRLAELLQILRRDRFFVGSPALFNALEKCINSGLQIDNQVGLGHRLVQELVEAVVNHQFRVIEGEGGEKLVLWGGGNGQG